MSKNNLFSIGEVAKLFHISAGSLRHYEKLGLIKPEYISPDSGYRYYSSEQFEILNTVRYLRALDMPLEEIKDFLCNREVDFIEEKLLKQKEIIKKKQQELLRIEAKINNRLAWLSDAKNTAVDNISVVRRPSCRIAWLENSLKITDCSDMEAPIRQLDKFDSEAVVFLGKVGLGISAEHLRSRKIERYDGIFLALDNEDAYDGDTILLDEVECVELRFKGSHNEARQQYVKMLEYIENNDLEIAGFSRETALIDYGVTNDTQKFVTEIVIPIKHKR